MNSQIVDYSFGQFGSAFINDTTRAFNPPPGFKVVAITALENVTFNSTNGLVVQEDNRLADQFLNTQDTRRGHRRFLNTQVKETSHRAGPITQGNSSPICGHNNNGNADHDTGEITLSIIDTRIKVGMIVENPTMAPRDIHNPYIVKSIDYTTVTETLVIARSSDPNTAVDHEGNIPSSDVSSGNNNAIIAFYPADAHTTYHNSQGHGGIQPTSSNMTIPKGVTIYGRYDQVLLASGSAIVYMGI